MKRGTPRHPKTKALARRLQIPTAHAVGILEMLWHFTADFAPRGDIGRLNDADIADAVEWVGEPTEFIGALLECGWLDRIEAPGRLAVHDWDVHCGDYTKKKIKDAGIGFANVQKIPENSATVNATVPSLALPSQAKPSHHGRTEFSREFQKCIESAGVVNVPDELVEKVIERAHRHKETAMRAACVFVEVYFAAHRQGRRIRDGTAYILGAFENEIKKGATG